MSTGARRDGDAGPGPRWWPAALIAAIASLALIWTWVLLDAPRQDRVIRTTSIATVGSLALLAWALLFSRFRAKTRVALLACVLVLSGAFLALFEVRGFSGDLVPLLSFRFSRAADLDAAPAAAPRVEADSVAAVAWRDWPQFLGPARDSALDDVRLDTDWTSTPPRLLWEREVGPAWSGFAVRGRDAITQEQRGERECVVCYDAETGDVRWLDSYPARYESKVAGTGPRATPTIAERRVYAMGATGILSCLDRESGERIWRRDTIAELGGDVNEWGISCSPLLVGDTVVVGASGAGAGLVAYDCATGEERWHSGDDPQSYASPMLADLLGRPQIVAFQRTSVEGHDPTSGAVLWSFDWFQRNPNVAQPHVIGNDRILVSSGYGVGCGLFRIRPTGGDGGWEVERVWKTLALKAKFANFVVYEGHAYGHDDGVFACVDLRDGSRAWKGGRYGHGQVIRCSDTLLVTGEFGELILVDATPVGHRERATFQAIDGKTWNPPAFAAPLLLWRGERIARCFELPLREAPAGE